MIVVLTVRTHGYPGSGVTYEALKVTLSDELAHCLRKFLTPGSYITIRQDERGEDQREHYWKRWITVLDAMTFVF